VRVEDTPTVKSPVKSSGNAPAKAPSREDNKPLVSDVDIYNRHLQDYLDGYLEDFGGLLDQDDDDGFDIFEDPELVEPPLPPVRQSPPSPAQGGRGSAPPISEVAFTPVDDDCASLFSEISVLV